MRFDLLCSSMLGTSTSARSNLSRLVLPTPLYLLLPQVLSRLDAFYDSSIDYMQNPFSRSKCFPLIRLDLALHIVPRIRYLGFTLERRRVP
jgi:hypothetical protein